MKKINLEELKNKYPKLYSVGVDIYLDDENIEPKEYFFKKPSIESYDRFVKSLSQSPTKAAKNFALDNIVEEQKEMLLADLEEYPAIALTVQDKLFGLLGLSKEVSLKKL